MHDQLTNLEALAASCLADSERWFPDLHGRGTLPLVVHFALGLGGEVGEAVDAMNADPDHLGEEMADVLTYALDIAGALRCPLDTLEAPSDPLRYTSAVPLVVHASAILNIVKKANRGDFAIELGHADEVGRHILGVIRNLERNAALRSIDLAGEHSRKRAICEGRWGVPA